MTGVLVAVGLGLVLTGLLIVVAAALADAHGHDGPVVFALVWVGAITCSVGILLTVGALLVAAALSLPR